MDTKGQGLLEVVILLPFLFILFGMLYRANMAIQMAINNQQYARSQLYIVTGYSPEYPRLGLRLKGQGMTGRMASGNLELMILGVSDPQAIAQATEGDTMPALPQIQGFGRPGARRGSQDAGEPALRTEIRIRETSSICTQMNSAAKGENYDSTGILTLGSRRWPFGKLACQYSGRWIGDLDE